MDGLSETAIRKDCPHCSLDSRSHFCLLAETENFHIVCDPHPLESGHLLVIPKLHVSCIGEYPPALFQEFQELYQKVSGFLLKQYESIAIFEHGVFGRTVFRSHVHLLPFIGKLEDIVPEGMAQCTLLPRLSALQQQYHKQGGYLFFTIGDQMWTVNTVLSAPRFFRDRFARALGQLERGNWKDMHQNATIMNMVDQENREVQAAWKQYHA